MRIINDPLNRLETVIDPQGGVTRCAYDPAGNPTNTALPNGANTFREFDPLNRIAYIAHRNNSGVFASLRYTMDAVGNPTAIEEFGGRKAQYTYDALDRLTEESIADPVNGDLAIDYAFDPVGNRLWKTENGTRQTDCAYDSNDRLLTETSGSTSAVYAWDDAGRLNSKTINGETAATYGWNALDHLRSASSASSVVQFQYDADGIRVSKAVDGTETRFLIDQVQPYAEVVEEYAPGGSIAASYVHGLGLIAQSRGGTLHWYHADHLGTTRALSGVAGSVTDTYAFDAYGNLLTQTCTTPNPHLYTGQRLDPETGFYYLRARYLAPDSGAS
ncbi:MAG TPA: hypothetical protein PLU30_01175 [Verrucomicrobiae bacterium]|nr:hypothetical protein [Verrucomicrobiae bacterium]